MYLLSVVAVAAALVLFTIWVLGSGLRRERAESRQVRSPDGGVWSTRLQWSHSAIRLGVAERVFVRRKRRTEEEEDDDTETYGPGRAVGDLLSGIDEGVLVIGGILAAGVVVVGAVLLLLLALELVLFLAVAVVVALGRLVLRHPWVLEVEDPSGHVTQVRVTGFRAGAASRRRDQGAHRRRRGVRSRRDSEHAGGQTPSVLRRDPSRPGAGGPGPTGPAG